MATLQNLRAPSGRYYRGDFPLSRRHIQRIIMHSRIPMAPLFGALLWAAPGLLLQAPPVLAQATTSPTTAVVAAVRGQNVTLAIGTETGATLGAVYEVRRGQTFARLQIAQLGATQSQASILSSSENFAIIVGDTATFQGVEALPVAPTPLEPAQPTPIEVAPNPLPVPTLAPAQSTPAAVAVPATVATLTGQTATVLSVQGQTLILSAGRVQGARPGQTVPILRSGQVVGLAKLSIVREDDSTANIVFVDEAAGQVLPGDAAGLLGATPDLGAPILSTPISKAPSAPTPFETGASNISVPKNSRVYELLGALASSGLIRSQPARIFFDDGARRHNTSEDVIFSRAQIAGFIREAIGNADDDANSRDQAALQILVKEFRRDLEKSGSAPTTLDAYRADKPTIGVSTWSRATVTSGGDPSNAREPFAESYGARRSKSGFDTHISAFGSLTDKLEFFASADVGSKIRDNNDPGSEIRNLFLRYDATKILRGLTVEVGRKEQWWGSGQFGTTILGDASGGLDSLQTSFKRGSYELRGIYARLGRGVTGQQRSLYGQSAIVNVGNSGRVGVNTVILSPKDGFDPKLFFTAFTPISLYIADRSGDGAESTNAVVNAFGEVAVAKGARLYGEIVLDDISLNNNNDVENRNGSLVGIHLFNPRNPVKAGFKAEYARLNAQSYLFLNLNGLSNRDADYTFYEKGAPLGYPIAPRLPSQFGGAESLRFEGYYQPTKRIFLTGGIEFSDINAEDQNPARVAGSGRGFSRQQIYRASATYDLSRNWSITGRVQRVATDQPNFVVFEPSLTGRFFSLELARAF